ncbi:MAG: hypothetical protein J2P40_09420 [Candidatus Dormibacteraeota bacterium]|nr:hypothetical protein [Candidatus Dormibacteraeota bacterium]MBO0704477.1 hypothetical protein [Candidatus Dormibacteraeota bacterium]MBO0761482.1 hypothetical protein [Candidatus Dormibacteraeota bacterium]
MERVRVSYELDLRVAVAVERLARNLGISESEVVSNTLYEAFDLGVLDELRQNPSGLTEEESLRLAYEELEAVRAERKRNEPERDT